MNTQNQQYANKVQVEQKCSGERLSQVQCEIEQLEKVAFSLQESLDQLTIRLQGVYQACPKPQSTTAPTEVQLVPLAEKIKSLRKCIQESNGRISDIIQGIEL